MAPILIQQPSSQAKEQWLRVDLSGSSAGEGGPDLVVVSGYAHYDDQISGSEDSDMKALLYVVELLVGPIWLRLVDVSPTVTITGYESKEADEADMMFIRVRSCDWEFPEPPEPRRIRLIVTLDIGGGEQARITSLGYHLVARGMLEPGQQFNENS